jgi:hypothetical protein
LYLSLSEALFSFIQPEPLSHKAANTLGGPTQASHDPFDLALIALT